MSAEPEVDSGTLLMLVGISPWPNDPPPNTHTNSTLFCVGIRNEHTGEVNSGVYFHQHERTAYTFTDISSTGTTQRCLLLRGSGAFNVHPFDNLWAIRKLLHLEKGTSRRSCHGRSCSFVSHTKIVLLLCSKMHSLHVFFPSFFSTFHSCQIQSKARLKSNFRFHHSCYFSIKILFTFPPCSTSWTLLITFPFKGGKKTTSYCKR